MNQILVTQKLYITPELKRKKKIYKFNFMISLFLVCILTSFYIYAEFDRNKSEATSHQLLTELDNNLAEEDKAKANENVLLVILDGTEDNYNQVEEAMKSKTLNAVVAANEAAETKTTEKGSRYKIIAHVEIPKINLRYPVLQGETGSVEETADLLKTSPCKFHGCEPNEIGNFCIVGHNYRNTKFFSKVPTLVIGDTVSLTDLTNRTITYEIYDMHSVAPENTDDTTQLTGGKKEITLITCTDDSKERVIVKCREVK